MPFATFTRVREVSSEDNIHLAENLIKSQSGKKWKTKNAGEKSAYVILEMSDTYQITGIDIGNEHSAFVEVLVGKSSCAPEDFTEILITCSFMTPPESKNSSNINRVRCFNRDALVPTAAEAKWSMVKILCTQPFNKHVPYGLSFIKIHVNDDAKKSSASQSNLMAEKVLNKTTELSGKLKFRADSPDSEAETSSSLFNRWKKSKENSQEQTTAASIRNAAKNHTPLETRRFSNDNKPTSSTPKANDKYLDRNRENLLFGEDSDDSANKKSEKLERLSEKIEADKKRRRMEKENEMNKKAKKSLDCSPKCVAEIQPKPSSSKTPDNAKYKSLENVNKHQSSSQENRSKKIKSPRKVKPFNELLKGVVLVISGIQNPDRADLRNKALALGAKYKADWDSTCTHLICAFKNTPKYNQVKGEGKIVTRSWIEKCYSLKKYLPWRRYALDSKELALRESDEEIGCATQKTQDEETDNLSDLETTNREESEEKTNTLALYDNDENSNGNNLKNNILSSEGDTDDEIKRVEKNIVSSKAAKKIIAPKTRNVFEVSTDEEDFSNENLFKKKPTPKTTDIYEVSTDEEDYLKEKLSKS